MFHNENRAIQARRLEGNTRRNIDYSIDSYAPVQKFSYELLLQNLGESNPVLSPVSAYLAVSMAGLGAEGETYKEFQEVLGLDMMYLPDDLANRLPEDRDGLQVYLANSVWLDERLKVQECWLTDVYSFYKADVYQTTLASEEAKNDINIWVEQNTEGLIPEFLSEPLKTDVDMMILDTVFFRGKWASPFEEHNTRKREFKLENGQVVMADTMSMLIGISMSLRQYFQNDIAEGVILPYRGDTYSFVAVKPAEGLTVRDMYEQLTMEKLMELVYTCALMYEHLTVEKLRELADTGTLKWIRLLMPKFEISFDCMLNDSLQDMGLCNAFGPQADFGKIAAKPFYISQVRQKAVFRLDEEGTEAAAATKVELMRGGVQEELLYPLYFDKPFLYMVIENETRVPLFMGIMDNPVVLSD